MRWAVIVAFLIACNGGDTASGPSASEAPASPIREVDTHPHEEQAAIATDRDRYELVEGPYGDELTIRSTLTAPPDQTVYVVNCNGQISAGLQSEVDGIWEDAWISMINQCLSEPIVISPGESHEYEFFVRRGSGSVVDSVDELPPPGTYRVIWHGVLSSFDAGSYPFGDPLPPEQRTSSPIVIE